MDTGLRRYDGVFFVVGRLGDGVPPWLEGCPRSGRGVGILSVCMGIFLDPCFCFCPPHTKSDDFAGTGRPDGGFIIFSRHTGAGRYPLCSLGIS